MTPAKESLSDKFIVATVQTLFFGILLALFGYWLNLRLETNKNELTQDTERMKAILQYNEPQIQQRRSAYIEIQQASRELTYSLESYYNLSEEPKEDEIINDKLQELEYVMVERYLSPSNTGSSGWGITKPEVFNAVEEIVFLRQKNKPIISVTILVAVDDFIEIVMDDLKLAEEEENNTEAFHTSAHKRAKDAYKQLDNIINQALGVDESPIQ
jgi:hypothetical protein